MQRKRVVRPRCEIHISGIPMSRRGIHPVLMGLDRPQRKTTAEQSAELSGNESAQRKRFLRQEEQDADKQPST